MTSTAGDDGPVAALAHLDHAILELVRARRALTRELLVDDGPPQRAILPSSLRVDEVVQLYVRELGPPAELVARSILNLCRPPRADGLGLTASPVDRNGGAPSRYTSTSRCGMSPCDGSS
jgi:hypothetical protein